MKALFVPYHMAKFRCSLERGKENVRTSIQEHRKLAWASLFCNADRGGVNSNLSQLQQSPCFPEVTLEKEVPSRCLKLMSAKPTQDVGEEG